MKNWLKYLITVLTGVALVFLTLLVKDTFHQTEVLRLYRDLSDAGVVSGITLIASGGLVYATNHGIFDGISYGVGLLFHTVRMKKDEIGRENYYEYKQRKSQNVVGFVHLIIVGVFFLCAGIVFTILFLTKYPG